MRHLPLLALLVAALCACGSPEPVPTTTGARIEAALAEAWPTAGPAREGTFSRDGRFAALSDASGEIVVRDTATWQAVVRVSHATGATAVAFSKDGTRLFSAGYDGQIREWDWRNRRVVRTLNGARGTIWTLDLSPDGTRLAAAGEDAVIRLWRLGAEAPPTLLRGHSRNVWEVRFSPDGEQLASGSFDNSVRLWDVATGKPGKVLNGHTEAIVGLDFAPDGRTLASGSDDSTIRLWRVGDGKLVRTIDNGFHVDAVAFSPDGRWLTSGGHARGTMGQLWHQFFGGAGEGDSVRIWRVSDARLVAALPHPEDVISLTLSPDGRSLLTSGEDNNFRLWRLSPAKP